MALKLISAPASDPVTVDELKLQLSMNVAGDEILLSDLIKSATLHGEGMSKRKFITQTWDYSLDYLPSCIEIPYSPLQSIASFKYIDMQGVEQTLATNQYKVDSSSILGRIVPAYGVVWPNVRNEVNCVTIRFVCGYGSPSNVPADIKRAILMLASHWFNYRGVTTTDRVNYVPMAAESLFLANRAY